MNVLSLFDGISCGKIALERASIHTENYYASEIDTHADGVSRANYPRSITRLGDVNGYKNWGISNINLLIGGSPCQDLSIAKANRQGLSGERSGLFWKYVDCLEKFAPTWFLLENNESMSSEAKNTISEVLGVEPILINSSLVSAQHRKRLYWTNIPNVTQPTDKGIKLKEVIESGTVDREKSLCLTRRYAGFCGSQSYLCRRYFGKRFGQAVFEGDIEQIKKMWKEDPYFESNEKNIRQMTPNECELLQTLPYDYTKFERINGELQPTPRPARYEMIGNGWTVDVISHILSHIPNVTVRNKVVSHETILMTKTKE